MDIRDHIETFQQYMEAFGEDDAQALSVLIRGARDIDAYISDNASALHYATGQNAPDCMRTLLRHGAAVDNQTEEGYTPLYNAQTPECARILLEAGANVEGAPSFVWDTPLHRVSERPNKTDVAQVLLEYGADINAQDHFGMTPLHHACHRGNKEGVHFLIEHGADINALDNDGQTPMMTAVSQRGDKFANGLVEVLLQSGADHSIRDASGSTAMDMARTFGARETQAVLEKHDMQKTLSLHREQGEQEGQSVRRVRKM
jgi:ankyrin repeat protein